MIEMTGLSFGLLTALFLAAYALLARSLAIKSESPLAFSIVFGVFAALFSLPIIVLEPGSFSGITSTVLLVTLLATLLWGIYDATQFYVRKHLEASRFTLIFQLTPIVALIGSILFLGENVTAAKLTAIFLIVGGNIFALYKSKGFVSVKGLLLACFAVLVVGCAYVADKAVFEHYPIGFYTALMFGAPVLYVIALFLIRREPIERIRNEFKRVTWRLPLLSFVCVAGFYSLLKTYQLVDLSVALPVAFTSSILTVIGGIIILGERDNIPQKIFGAFVVFIGVVLLNL
jgi:drug/metabolite transporter (DMT)-like permease